VFDSDRDAWQDFIQITEASSVVTVFHAEAQFYHCRLTLTRASAGGR
jgi:hypothetical protein